MDAIAATLRQPRFRLNTRTLLDPPYQGSQTIPQCPARSSSVRAGLLISADMTTLSSGCARVVASTRAPISSGNSIRNRRQGRSVSPLRRSGRCRRRRRSVWPVIQSDWSSQERRRRRRCRRQAETGQRVGRGGLRLRPSYRAAATLVFNDARAIELTARPARIRAPAGGQVDHRGLADAVRADERRGGDAGDGGDVTSGAAVVLLPGRARCAGEAERRKRLGSKDLRATFRSRSAIGPNTGFVPALLTRKSTRPKASSRARRRRPGEPRRGPCRPPPMTRSRRAPRRPP